MRTPFTIRQIIEQAGGTGLRGAFVYCGARNLEFRHPAELQGTSCRPGFRSRLSSEDGAPRVLFEVGLIARVNGKPGRKWQLVVVYEPDDTYTVWLVEGRTNRTADSTLLACVRDVYCDNLQDVIEHTYDEAIRTHNNGFIHIS